MLSRTAVLRLTADYKVNCF
uniref:Uncharacterized protein n=1 Tax=Anguilla anguilla TaxID=7936 RepID=A0A0E9STI8_ANGAN